MTEKHFAAGQNNVVIAQSASALFLKVSGSSTARDIFFNLKTF